MSSGRSLLFKVADANSSTKLTFHNLVKLSAHFGLGSGYFKPTQVCWLLPFFFVPEIMAVICP